ncbi:hypothetical protein Tco_0486678 [Tanacetum coccineum]
MRKNTRTPENYSGVAEKEETVCLPPLRSEAVRIGIPTTPLENSPVLRSGTVTAAENEGLLHTLPGTKSQKNYTTHDLELGAVVFALKI